MAHRNAESHISSEASESLDMAQPKSSLNEVTPDRTPTICRREIIWSKLIFLSAVHIIALYALTILPHCNVKTLVFGPITFLLCGLGVTAGAHRMWAHRSYQGKLPLRIFLAMMNCAAWQVPILHWCRDHRTHHKCSETDGDPSNASRGFIFSHIGWLVTKKHPDVIKHGKTIDLSDLYQDPVVTVQNKIFLPGAIMMCIVLPTAIPCCYWGENPWLSFCTTVLRYCVSLNAAFSVNSFAHLFGGKPYDVRINPAENKAVAFLAMGEGFHNYHHVFPQDYSTSEFGFKLNPTTAFIDFMALIGQAYNRKKTPEKMIEARKQRTGYLKQF